MRSKLANKMFIVAFSFIKRYWILSRLQSILLVLFAFIVALFESLGMFLIWPAIGLFVQGENARHSVYGQILGKLGFDPSHAIVLVCVSIVAVYIFKNIFILFSERYTHTILERWKNELTAKTANTLFSTKYEYVRTLGVQEISNILKISVPYIIDEFCGNLIKILSQLIILLTILFILLAFIGPFVIMITFFGLTISLIIARVLRHFIGKVDRAVETQSNMFQHLIDNAMIAFREIKSFQVEKNVELNFQSANEKKSSNEKMLKTIKLTPSLINEVLFMALLMFVMITVAEQNSHNEVNNIFQTLGILVVSFLRLIPSVNSINISFQMLKSSISPIENFINFMDDAVMSRNATDRNRVLTSFAEGQTLISANNVCYAISDTRKIKNLSFDIKIGTLTAITGPSGVGKSTLINIICGFQSPSAGSLRYNKRYFQDLSKIPIYFAPAFQENHMFEESLIENIRFMRPGLTASKFHKYVDMLGLQYLFDTTGTKKVSDGNGVAATVLSGGEKQRVSVLRALLSDARVLVLDEPTSALDEVSRKNMMEIIKEECRRGRTVIVVSHDAALINCSDIKIELNDSRK